MSSQQLTPPPTASIQRTFSYTSANSDLAEIRSLTDVSESLGIPERRSATEEQCSVERLQVEVCAAWEKAFPNTFDPTSDLDRDSLVRICATFCEDSRWGPILSAPTIKPSWLRRALIFMAKHSVNEPFPETVAGNKRKRELSPLRLGLSPASSSACSKGDSIRIQTETHLRLDEDDIIHYLQDKHRLLSSNHQKVNDLEAENNRLREELKSAKTEKDTLAMSSAAATTDLALAREDGRKKEKKVEDLEASVIELRKENESLQKLGEDRRNGIADLKQ
jgi:hypothetical protein